jgi:hypothetical protein
LTQVNDDGGTDSIFSILRRMDSGIRCCTKDNTVERNGIVMSVECLALIAGYDVIVSRRTSRIR